MKKILLITIILLTVSGSLATELLIHKTNGVIISVEMEDIVNIDFSGEQAALLQLLPVPSHLDWVVSADNEPKIANLIITLKDGNDQPMVDQEVLLSGSLGEPVSGEYSFMTDENGQVEVEWKFEKHECPPPSTAGPGTTSATMDVEVLGSALDKRSNIILFRYVD